MVKFINNADLLREIEKSQNSYCWFLNELAEKYEKVVGSLSEVVEERIVYRVMTNKHIPYSIKDSALNFKPFKHFIKIDGNLIEVGRSHWQGSIENGHFSMAHGRITNSLGEKFMIMVKNFSRRANWRDYSYRDEFENVALLNLVKDGLNFNVYKTNLGIGPNPPNPFSYYTQMMYTSFLRVLKHEKALAQHRSRVMQDNGYDPSFSDQIDYEMEQNFGPDTEPAKKKFPGGRKKKAETPTIDKAPEPVEREPKKKKYPKKRKKPTLPPEIKYGIASSASKKGWETRRSKSQVDGITQGNG